MRGDEALGQQHPGRLRVEAFLPVTIGRGVAAHAQAVGPGAVVGQQPRLQPVARIAPAEVQPAAAQVGRAQRGGQQLAMAQHFGLPLQSAFGGARLVQQGLQRGQVRADHGFRIQPQFGTEYPVPLHQPGDALARVLGAGGDRLQFVGHARKRRDHHQHPPLRGPVGGDAADVVPTLARRHAGATEFEDGPAGVGCSCVGGHRMAARPDRGHRPDILSP